MDIAAISVLMDAKEGRYARLIQRLRDMDVPLDPSEREFLADLLDGKEKLGVGRPKDGRLPLRNDRIAQFVDVLTRNYQPSNSAEAARLAAEPTELHKVAVALAAEEFGVSESTVYSALRDARKRSS